MIRFTRPLLLAASLAVLTACSSGGGSSFTPPAPVLAPIGPIAPAAFNGKEFPLYFARLDGSGGSIQGLRAVGAADVISEQEVTITIAGQTYVLVDTLPVDGEFTDGSATADISPFATSMFGLTLTGPNDITNGYYGFQTAVADMPGGGPVVYSSTDTSRLGIYINGGLGGFRTGDTFLVLNFTNGSITGELFRDSDFVMSIANGSISGNTFSGTVTATYDDGMGGGFAPTGTANTSASGQFFSSSGGEIGGTYEGEFTAPLPGNITDFVGAFLATD